MEDPGAGFGRVEVPVGVVLPLWAPLIVEVVEDARFSEPRGCCCCCCCCRDGCVSEGGVETVPFGGVVVDPWYTSEPLATRDLRLEVLRGTLFGFPLSWKEEVEAEAEDMLYGPKALVMLSLSCSSGTSDRLRAFAMADPQIVQISH